MVSGGLLQKSRTQRALPPATGSIRSSRNSFNPRSPKTRRVTRMRSYAVDRYRGVDLGWDGIFKKLIRELKKDNPSVLLLDAQQKAGALYVYVARSGPRSEELIARATRESRTVCQLCGKDGVLRQNHFGVYQVRCAAHGRGWREPPELPMFPAEKIRCCCDAPDCIVRPAQHEGAPNMRQK